MQCRRIVAATVAATQAHGPVLTRIGADKSRPVQTQNGLPRTVGAVFGEEKPRLLALPDPLPETDLIVPIPVDSQGFIRLDTNRYSVPSALSHRTLTLIANDRVVRVLDGQTEVARHARSFGRKKIIEEPVHREALVAERRAARDLKGRDRLCHIAPQFNVLVERWAQGGHSMAIQVTRAIKLLDLYGNEIFALAVGEIVARGLRDISALAVACDRLRRERNRPVPVDIALPDHIVDRDVIPHNLENYDDQ